MTLRTANKVLKQHYERGRHYRVTTVDRAGDRMNKAAVWPVLRMKVWRVWPK